MKRYSVYLATVILGIVVSMAGFTISTYAQNTDNIPFHEIARIIVNATETPNAIASVTLQSTSIEDMTIDPELANRITTDERIAYIALDNKGTCVLGVNDESCILVSILRSGKWETIDEIQSGARKIGDSYIDSLNEMFDTRAEFHSVFIHYNEEARLAQASDRRIVSAVYTMPREDTASMFEKIGGIVLAPEIRRGGGFYDVARYILATENPHMLFSITPIAGSHLIQMRITAESPVTDIHNIDPIALLSADTIERSEMFAQGSNPLGSIIQVVVISPDEQNIVSSESPILPTRMIDGEQVPLSVNMPGWVFDLAAGNIIKAKYIFGTNNLVEDSDLVFTLKTTGSTQTPIQPMPAFSIPVEIVVMVLAIIAGAITAIWFLLRRS